MASTSGSSAARSLLEYCLSGERWPDHLLHEAIAENEGRALFGTVIERLADLFEPRLCDTYSELFSEVIAAVRPEFRSSDLIERYRRVRQVRRCEKDPLGVYVLSRVTLGADVAVTSIVLDAAKKRFPKAAIYFVGPRKNYELFAADPRVRHYAFEYPRGGGVQDRLQSWPRIDAPNSIIIDPDSRLSQLGLLPVCAEDDFYFFESRSYGGDGDESLVQLTQQWVSEVFSIEDACAFVAPRPIGPEPDVAVSFGVGENLDKRVGDSFEAKLLSTLATLGNVLLDSGASKAESERVQRAAGTLLHPVQIWSGAYAPFAYAISKAGLYIGYDSAGQHVAAACGTPLVSVFAGYASERMFARWRPSGSQPIRVIKAGDADPDWILQRTLAAIKDLRR